MITITLQVKELLYDIQNKTYLTGRAREGENSNNFVAASNMVTSDDSENSYQVCRSLNDAFAALNTELAEYISSTETTASNIVKDVIDADGILTISLAMPSNYNSASVTTLGAAFHQYLVSMAIADWFGITNKSEAEDYQKQAESALQTVRRAVHKRSRPSRPTYAT